jgi:hypothetical protein
MLNIARRKYPELNFILGDIRNFRLKKEFDAIIFIGKGSAYLTTDADALSAVKSMKQLISSGVIIIDGFDADFIIPNFKKNIEWSQKIGSRTITRKSINKLNHDYRNTWNRKLTYIVKDEGKNEKKYADNALLRGFSDKDLKYLFSSSGIINFKINHVGDTIIAIGVL